ncbi:hypothetical protein BW716_29730 [[Flexibacter] sp. ATCC 35208]|nr:hypothetical protein BW716_29730 [[Flexibacter] sp. ATCC 35208]
MFEIPFIIFAAVSLNSPLMVWGSALVIINNVTTVDTEKFPQEPGIQKFEVIGEEPYKVSIYRSILKKSNIHWYLSTKPHRRRKFFIINMELVYRSASIWI